MARYDADSLFVLVGEGPGESQCRQIGAELAGTLNWRWAGSLEARHRVASYLELQFEEHYLRFFMPTSTRR